MVRVSFSANGRGRFPHLAMENGCHRLKLTRGIATRKSGWGFDACRDHVERAIGIDGNVSDSRKCAFFSLSFSLYVLQV